MNGGASDGGLLWLGPKHEIEFDRNAEAAADLIWMPAPMLGEKAGTRR